MSLPAFLLLTDIAENRTLCRARALSKREAFVASGRGRRQAAEAGADLRSKYADSPRNAPARYRCDADRASCPGLNPSTDSPNRGESNSMQGASVKQTRSVCSERARTPAGGRSRCGFAKQIRGFSAQSLDPIWMRCYRISACRAPQQRRVGRAFPTATQAETATRDPRSDWGVVSGWLLKRKLRPGIEL